MVKQHIGLMMNTIKHYDAIILGGGKAGKTLAIDLAQSGQKIAMIERGMIGGTCINVGCIPTKTMIATAKQLHQLTKGQEFGFEFDNLKLDFKKIRARKDSVVNSMVQANHKSFIDSGMDLIMGSAKFVAPKKIEVLVQQTHEKEFLTAEKIFINTGAKPFIPDIPGLSDTPYLTNENIMDIEQVPKRLIILGGGYIGLEFGQMFARFGSQVEIVEMSSEFIPLEDRDIAECVYNFLTEEKIKIHLGAKAVKISNYHQQVIVTVESSQGIQEIEGDALLVAVGRLPESSALNLAATGVTTDARGFVLVNEFLETNVPGIYALGDIKGGPQFTHLSLDDYRIVKHNLLNSEIKKTISSREVPYTVFLDPELARFGLTEKQAHEKNIPILVAKIPAAMVPRAKTLGETKGFLKAIIHKESHQILGVALVCVEAGELMSALEIAMNSGCTYETLRDMMYAHPTMVECFNLLFAKPV